MEAIPSNQSPRLRCARQQWRQDVRLADFYTFRYGTPIAMRAPSLTATNRCAGRAFKIRLLISRSPCPVREPS